MDCDCTAYSRAWIEDAPRSIVAWLRAYERHCEWLDGPESTSFAPPSQIEPHYRSRDLALEAYEDGHPHHIVWSPA